MRDVQLSPGIPGGKWARLRSLRGYDEIRLEPSGVMDPIEFIDRLIIEAPGTSVTSGCAAELSVSDCDRLFASVYIEYFGERVEGRVTCGGCAEPFDMNFSLPDLMRNLTSRGLEVGEPDAQGIFTSPDGRRFRLPTAREQRQVAVLETGAAMAALLERCVPDEYSTADTHSIEILMEQAGPVLDLDLDAACPHCGAAQTVRFDIQSFLFRALGHEKQFLLYEVHRIATAYGWTYDETLGLTRDDRRRLVQLIESERSRRRRGQSWKGI